MLWVQNSSFQLHVTKLFKLLFRGLQKVIFWKGSEGSGPRALGVGVAEPADDSRVSRPLRIQQVRSLDRLDGA